MRLQKILYRIAVEGLNSLIQAARRKVRGFRTYEGFRCMIMLMVGRLKPDCIPLLE
ncbi:MAG: transposase [Christensenellales bacterium]